MPFSTCPGQWLPSSLGKAFQVMNLPESCWKLSFAIGVVEAIHSFWGDSVCCFRARSIGLLAKTMKQEEIRSSLSTMDSWVKTGCSCEWIPPNLVEPFRSDCWPTRNSAPTQASCLQSGLLVLSKRPKSVRSWAGTEKLRTAGKAFLLEGHPLNKTLCAERPSPNQNVSVYNEGCLWRKSWQFQQCERYSGLYTKLSDQMHAAGDEAVALVSSSCAQGGVEQAIAFPNDQILPCCSSFRIRAPKCFAEFSPSQGIIESACSSWLDSGCTPGSLGVEYLSEN